MDRKKIIMKSCLDQIFQLFDDILLVIPNDSDILAAKVYVSGVKQANPKLILTSWYNTVTIKYKEQIDKGDFDFAINNDYNNDIQKHYDETSNDFKYFEKMIEKVRDVVKNLDDDNRQKLIKYVQNISNLTLLYFDN